MPRKINTSQCDPLITLIPPVTTLRYLLHVERDELNHPARQSNSPFCGVTTCQSCQCQTPCHSHLTCPISWLERRDVRQKCQPVRRTPVYLGKASSVWKRPRDATLSVCRPTHMGFWMLDCICSMEEESLSRSIMLR